MMEISPTMYLPELGMEDPTLFDQYLMDYLGCPIDEGLDFESFVSGYGESYASYECPNSKRTRSPESVIVPLPPAPRPSKQLKTNKASASDSSSKIISFQHSNTSSVANSHQFYNLDSHEKLENLNENLLDFASLSSQGTNFVQCDKKTNQLAGTIPRNALQAQDHVMAERKRREKLNQRFIALSSIIPGLKKMDKATVLGDAIKYVKQLQEREKFLEEQVAMKTVESAVLLRRSILFADNDRSSSDENFDGRSGQPLPEIEARVSGKEVLIRIHCEKHNGCEATILRELEKLHLTVQSSSIVPFGKTTLCMTIVAQMDKEHCMTAKDLVKGLRKALGHS